MVTTRRGKTTAATPASPGTGKAKGKAAQKKDVSNGSYAEAETQGKAARTDKKRSAGDTGPAADVDPSKRQKKVADSAAGADLQVKEASPPLQEKAALPEADTITAAAAVDPPAGAETAVAADDLTGPPSAPAEDNIKKPDVTNTSEMPVIGGTKAGSAPVAEAPTAGKALDSVPVGPDPAAAGTAAVDTPQDGDYFLDATLADSFQGNDDSKPAERVTESMGTTDATKTGFQAPPASAAPTHTLTDTPSAPTHTLTEAPAASGMATDVAAASIDVAPGVQADKGAVPHLPTSTGVSDGMQHPIATAPTTVNAHDSHFGAAATQDAVDLPSAMYGSDNA